jgi:superfamily II RNA helicase
MRYSIPFVIHYCYYAALCVCMCVFVCVQGKPSPLLSSFRLSYYTLLNLLKRVEGGTSDLEYVIAHSFQQFQQERAMPRVRVMLLAGLY